MHIPPDPRDLAITLLNRSTCAVQVAAVLVDRWGVFAWGWNSSGQGFGEHAEAACLRRANRRRVEGATLFTAARRVRGGAIVTARPCAACSRLLKVFKVRHLVWRERDGWKTRGWS